MFVNEFLSFTAPTLIRYADKRQVTALTLCALKLQQKILVLMRVLLICLYYQGATFMEKFIHRFYDSHPELPLDPDSDQFKIIRPIHTDRAHIAVVAIGAFFGTLARYKIGLWLPNGKSGWPTATLLINILGAFLLGLLLQALLHRGKDEGSRRILRLTLGTGFLGAFTTYSSLATSVVLLVRNHETAAAALYAVASIALGMAATAIGIRIATRHHARKRSTI